MSSNFTVGNIFGTSFFDATLVLFPNDWVSSCVVSLQTATSSTRLDDSGIEVYGVDNVLK